jgi:hypothetical protein
MALRKVLELRIVSARALKVEKAVLSSLDQYGYCWRILSAIFERRAEGLEAPTSAPKTDS